MAVTISFGEAYDVSWFWWYCYSRRQGQTKWFLGPYMDLSFLVPDLEGTLKLRVIELKKQQHIAIVTKKKFKKKIQNRKGQKYIWESSKYIDNFRDKLVNLNLKLYKYSILSHGAEACAQKKTSKYRSYRERDKANMLVTLKDYTLGLYKNKLI